MLPAELAELVSLQAIRIVLFVLIGGIIPLLASRTGQIDDLSHLVLLSPTDLYFVRPEFP
jgi:hypothetical protein